MEELIRFYIKKKEFKKLQVILKDLQRHELKEIFKHLKQDEQVIFFEVLSEDKAVALFKILGTQQQKNLLDALQPPMVQTFLNQLSSDDRVRLFDRLPERRVKSLLGVLTPDNRAETLHLQAYVPETAGRIMTTEFVTLTEDMTQEKALAKVTEEATRKENIYILFIIDEKLKLTGFITLHRLLMMAPTAVINEHMSRQPISVKTSEDQEKVAQKVKELDLLALAVVDDTNKLVGIVTFDDAMEILEEEATEDILNQAGLSDLKDTEEDRSKLLINGKLNKILAVRLPFLLATLLLSMLSGLVIENFEQTLESIAMVAIFIPLIMGMGGNIGTQSSTVFTRGLVLGHIEIENYLEHFFKELRVGLTIGALMGIMAGLMATIWLGFPMLGLAVGLALFATMTVASLLGFLVPFILIKLKIDQAAGSAPIITTIKDLVALLIYFTCISLFLGHLIS
ncbi:magnesium transporter [Lactococcus petauri]|uniref:Magnesium transporter MgtE n=1 Tax=Lactococcus petauri TaxID=1940789 RepID=A0ABZ2SIQ2_9LACT|nr:magnesium transporter [Lactococcus petauri]OAL08604.1 Magnesium transporter MgtE [Lactococcus garvieae]MCI3871720.1 magnesium transporter [Lactococcus petauri]MCQ8275755.1 Magnesium transporter MgtE [Lactococcus petauri]MCR6589653.1 magnesium transporter [Lactococcus petauri]MCU7363932.1 magnesium transporter [Lactococcus petauri]